MNRHNKNEPSVYYIPANFVDSGTVFGGMIKLRNFVEAIILAVAAAYPILQLRFSFSVTIVLLLVVCLPILVIGCVGANDDSLVNFFISYIKWRKSRRILKYSGKIFLEDPKKYEASNAMLPRDRMLKLIESVTNKPIITSRTSEPTNYYALDIYDDDYVLTEEPSKNPKENKPIINKAEVVETFTKIKQGITEFINEDEDVEEILQEDDELPIDVDDNTEYDAADDYDYDDEDDEDLKYQRMVEKYQKIEQEIYSGRPTTEEIQDLDDFI